MQIGINVGLAPYRAPRPPLTYEQAAKLGRAVDELGFDSLWIADHLMYREPDGWTTGPLEAWTLLGALAAITQRVQLGPFVSPIPFRPPAMLAKMATTVDQISGGRLILGLGTGIDEAEFRAFGYPFHDRFERFAEAVPLIARLLKGERVDHRGVVYELSGAEVYPQPVRAAGIPVLIGGKGPRMLRLAAQHADAWNGFGIRDPEELTGLLTQLRAACDEVGRDPDSLEITVSAYVVFEDRYDGNEDTLPSSLVGGDAAIAAGLAAYARAGVDRFIARLAPATVESFERLRNVVEQAGPQHSA